MRRFRPLIFFALTFCAAAGTGSAAELTVFAAASLSDVLQVLAPAFKGASGHTLRFNFGASGTLARQIEEGAPADVFISADELRVDRLDKAKLLLAGTRRILLRNTLVLVVAADDGAPILTLDDLKKPPVRRIAIGDPATVPAGTYAKEHLQKIGLWEPLQKRMVPVDNVRAVLAAVESGNVDAGFVYKTDASISRKVRVALEISANEGPKIVYPVAVLKDSKSPEAARALVDFLTGPEARVVFERFGFLSVGAK